MVSQPNSWAHGSDFILIFEINMHSLLHLQICKPRLDWKLLFFFNIFWVEEELLAVTTEYYPESNITRSGLTVIGTKERMPFKTILKEKPSDFNPEPILIIIPSRRTSFPYCRIIL